MSGLRATPLNARRTPPGLGSTNSSRQTMARAKETMFVATVASAAGSAARSP
jgi:hypothetical protein